VTEMQVFGRLLADSIRSRIRRRHTLGCLSPIPYQIGRRMVCETSFPATPNKSACFQGELQQIVYNIEVRPVFRYNRTDHVNLFADSWRLARRLVLE
jgi:hypothetical protein